MQDRSSALYRSLALRPGVVAPEPVGITYGTDMGPERVLDGEPSRRARILGRDTEDLVWALLLPGELDGEPIECVGLVGTNIGDDAWVRVLADPAQYDYTPDVNAVLLDAILGDSNVGDGIPADILASLQFSDDDWATPDNRGESWYVHASLAALVPPIVAETGTAAQAFSILARRQGPASGHPRVAVELWEAGVLVAELGERAVTSTTGQTLLVRWTPDDLVDPAGDDVEIRVVCTPATGSDGTSGTASYVEIDRIAWEVYRPTTWEQDSGWVQLPGPGGARRRQLQAAAVALLDPAIAARHVTVVWVSDDSVSDDIAVDGDYHEAGVVILGERVWGPTENEEEFDHEAFRLSPSEEGDQEITTLGGQDLGRRGYLRRLYRLRYPAQLPASGWDLVDLVYELDGEPLLLWLYPDEAEQGSPITSRIRHGTVWGELRSSTLGIGSSPVRTTPEFVFREKL